MKLEKVLLSQEVSAAWDMLVNQAGVKIKELYPDLDLNEVDEATCQIQKDRSLQITQKVRDIEIILDVPRNHWSFNHKLN